MNPSIPRKAAVFDEDDSDDALRRRMEARCVELRIPLRLHLDLTWRCPWSCEHCYLRDSEAGGELSTAEWRGVMTEARALGTVFLALSGGDPMTRADFWTLAEAAREMHFAVRLKTTGWFLDRAAATRLAKLGQVSVDVSLHGARAGTHDAFARRPGGFDRAVAAIEALAGAGVPTRVATCAVAGNVDELAAIRERCEALEVHHTVTTSHFSSREGGATGGELPEDVQARVLGGQVEPSGRPPRPDDALCKGGVSGWYITPVGDVTPCVAWPQRFGNVRDGGLGAIIASDEARGIARLRQADRARCDGCPDFAWCIPCPGEAWIECRDPLAPSVLACRRARVRRALWNAAREAGR